MPITIPDALPAAKTLESENIFVMTEGRALKQDIRPLRIAILNIMPTKIETETQLLRLLSNTPLQIEIELLQTASHTSKNTSQEHLLKFYKTFYDVKEERFDGLIITGAPVEQMDYNEVNYWDELCEIMEWAKKHVYSTMYICWAAQAGLKYHHGVDKILLPEKLSGIYKHKPLMPLHPLLRGFDETFYAPHSRYTGLNVEQIKAAPDLDILAESEEAGPFIIANRACRDFFITGHAEYSLGTLAGEYQRDVAKGMNPKVPANYFPDDDPTKTPVFKWRSHANLLFANWLNHIVYQHTPYNLMELI